MHRLSLLVLVASSISTVGGCVPDSGDEGLIILKNVVPQDGCVVSAAETELFLAQGTMSIFAPSSYHFIAQVKSRIIADETSVDQRTVFMQSANIDLTFPGSTLFPSTQLTAMQTAGVTHFKSLFSAPILPNGGLTDAGFDIIKPSLFAEIVKADPGADKFVSPPRVFELQVLATITIIGSMGGSEVTSQPFQFPITISNQDVGHVAGTCPLPFGTVVSMGNACGNAQDASVTCCNQGDMVFCPATVAPMAPP